MSQLLGRDLDIKRLWEAVQTRSVLLQGPRRVGKTELLREMAARPSGGWRVISLDLQGAKSSPELLRRWDAATPPGAVSEAKVRELAGAALATAAGVSAQDLGDPWARIEQLTQRELDWMKAEERLLVVIDEVPWWLDAVETTEGIGAARSALANLRHLRQLWPTQLRFVLTGSVGLAGLAADLGASADVNDLDRQTLDPLGVTWSKALFRAEVSSLGRTATEEASEKAAALTGGLPHWIKEMAQRSVAVGSGEVSDGHVQLAVKRMLEPAMRDLLRDELQEHFIRRHADHASVMAALLNAAAEADETPEEALVSLALQRRPDLSRRRAQELIYRLADAWYLCPGNPGNWRFLTPLFRMWWNRYGVEA